MPSRALMNRMYGPVTRIRIAPDGTEDRAELKAHIQTTTVTLPVTSDVEEGDLLERKLRNGKTQTIRLTEVTHHETFGPGRQVDRITAKFVNAQARPPVAQRKVTLPGLHSKVSDAAGTLYEDGHYSRAIHAAIQAVEARVQQLTGSGDIGQKLMGDAFKEGALDVTTSVGANRDSERDGFKLLFMGAIGGLRNPRAHGVDTPVDAEEALETLAFASLLMRRLDLAEARLTP